MNTQMLDAEGTSQIDDSGPSASAEDLDALYQSSLEHFQNGRWQEAIEGFEAVLRLNPGHSEAQAFLEEARLKASLDQAKPKPKRSRPSRRLKQLIWAALGALAVVGVIVLGRWAYGRWVEPQKQAQQAKQHFAQQLDKANAYLAERDYAAAEQAFQQLLELDPTNASAQQGLAEAQTKSALAASYAQAMQAIATEDWGEATRILTEIIAQDSSYKDAKAQLASVQNRQQLASAFDNAEKAYQADDWKAAISAFEALRNLDAEFRRDEVTTRLFDSYLKQGVALVADDEGGGEAVRQAQDLFKKALTLKPQQAQAMLELDLATKYLEAQTLLAQGNVQGATAALEALVKQYPDYASGNAAAMLRRATGAEVIAATAPVTPTAATTETLAKVTPEPTAVQGGFQAQYASWMLKGDEALDAKDYAGAEQNYREAMAFAVHGGYSSARWLFAAYAKAGTAAARGGNNESGIEQIRTAISIMTKSAVAIPAETYSGYVSQGDSDAQKKDYASAFAQYSKALQVISQKCNCGLENWSVL